MDAAERGPREGGSRSELIGEVIAFRNARKAHSIITEPRFADDTRSRIGRALSGAVWAVVVLVVAGIFALVAATFAGLARVDVIQSGSMRPVLPVGSDVLVVPEPQSAVRTGQVIAFTPPKPYPQVTVVHEVVSVERALGYTVVRTKGVANKVDDPWTLVLRGKVWHVVDHVPVLGYATAFLRIGAVQAVILVLLAGAVFAGVVQAIRLFAGGRPEEARR
jgi:signal peptidase I